LKAKVVKSGSDFAWKRFFFDFFEQACEIEGNRLIVEMEIMFCHI